MRVTNQGLMNSILINLQRNVTQLEDYQSRIASGKRVLEPSDDPAATVKILDLRSQMTQADQYRQNAQDGMDWLEQTDNVMNQIETTLQRVREVATAAANGTNNAEAYRANAAELDQIISGLAELGNSTIGDLYIFSGQAVNTKPIELTTDSDDLVGSVTYADDPSQLKREIGPGVYVPVNSTAQDMFLSGDAGSPLDLLSELIGLRKALTALGNGTGDATAQATVNGFLGKLGAAEDALLTVHTDVGARSKRLEAAVTRSEALTDGLTKLISKQEDLDVPKAILELSTADASYKLSLQMGARMVQPTLLDFLR